MKDISGTWHLTLAVNGEKSKSDFLSGYNFYFCHAISHLQFQVLWRLKKGNTLNLILRNGSCELEPMRDDSFYLLLTAVEPELMWVLHDIS